MAATNERASVIIAEYLRRRDAGEPVDEQQLLASNPELADELKRYLDNEAAIAALAIRSGPNRETVHAGDVGDSVPAHTEPLKDLPAEFGRYRVSRILGQGAMGAVYLANDTVLGRQVALKTPKLGGTESPEVAERFEREARAAATLHHRNICPVFDVGEIDGVRYLTMAYIEGKPLSAFISRKQQLSERQAAIAVRKLARALEAAHRAGVIHRDLKPDNVMVDRSGEPVIMDFGLARKEEGREQIRLTQEGTIMGSPAYMSPEQVSGAPNAVGSQSDIFSLGVILYELLTGRLPFDGGVTAVLAQILAAEPPQLEELRPGVDARLVRICSRMMAKSISDRYQTMQEVVDDLSEILKVPHPPGAGKDERRQSSEDGSIRASTEELSIFRRASMIARRSLVGERADRHEFPMPAAPSPQTAGAEVGSGRSLRRWTIAGLGGLLLLFGVVIYFRGGRAEVDDGSTVRIDQDGDSTSLTVTPPAVEVPRFPGETNNQAAQSKPRRVVAPQQNNQWTDLFADRDFAGWKGLDGRWKWEGAELVGSSQPGGINFNTVLCSDREYRDFELRFDVKLDERSGNSGVQIRSQLIDLDRLIARGPQVDIGQEYWGSLYGEKMGGMLERPPRSLVDRVVRRDDYNAYVVRCIGEQVTITVNGTTLVDGEFPSIPRQGLIGLQLHSGEGMTVRFRNMQIRELTPAGANAGPLDEPDSSPSVGTVLASSHWKWSAPVPFLRTRNDSVGEVARAHRQLPDVAVACRVYEAGEAPNRDLMIIHRTADGWSDPAPVGDAVNTPGDEASPFVSTDGLTLIFESDRPGGLGETDLWMSRRATLEDAFPEPVNLGASVNSPRTEGRAAMSDDGLTLVFTSNRDGGNGASDLWSCRRASIEAPWSPARNLGAPINTNRRELGPILTPDGHALLFTSDRRGGIGGADIWLSRRESVDGDWSEPINLGGQVNSRTWDSVAWLAPDGSAMLVNTQGAGQQLFRRVPVAELHPAPAHTTAGADSPDYTRLATGQWVSLMGELRQRASEVPGATLTSDGGILMDDTGFVIDWMPARNAILRAKVRKLTSEHHPGMRLRFLAPEITGRDDPHHWYATYLDDWNRFGVGRQKGRKWKDFDTRKLERQDGFFEWTLAVVGDDIRVYVDGSEILSSRDRSLHHGYPLIYSGPQAIFQDVEMMVLDDTPAPHYGTVVAGSLVDIHRHPIAAIWTRRVGEEKE